MHYKTFIWMIVRGCKNYVRLLVNWVHNKTLICASVQACKNYPCTLVDSMHSKPSFVEVFELTKITQIS